MQTGFLLRINSKNRNNVSIPLDTKQYSVGCPCLLKNKTFSENLSIPLKYLLAKLVKGLIFHYVPYTLFTPPLKVNLSFLGKNGVFLIGFVFFYHNTLT